MVFLDTDVLVDVLRKHPPAVARLDSLGETDIGLSGFVAIELMQGCRDKSQQGAVSKTLKRFRILWPLPAVCDEAIGVFARYRLSQGLGAIDALVGQHAVSLGLPLCTVNEKHYASIPQLQTMQPYSR